MLDSEDLIKPKNSVKSGKIPNSEKENDTKQLKDSGYVIVEINRSFPSLSLKDAEDSVREWMAIAAESSKQVELLKEPRERPRLLPVPDDIKNLTKIYNDLPDHKKAEFLSMAQDFAEKAKHQPPPLPESCPPENTYDVWKVTNHSKDGKQCLKENWGQWLKAFNPDLDRDYMSQADLGKLDFKLLTRLKKQFVADDLNKLVPSLPALNDQINASKISPEKIKEALEIRNYVVSRGLSLENRAS